LKSIVSLSAVAIALLLWALFTRQAPDIELLNQSGVAVEELRVSIADTPVLRTGLGAGDLDRHRVSLRREGPLTIELHFAGGVRREFRAGWFSPAQAHPTRIRILSVDSLQVGH